MKIIQIVFVSVSITVRLPEKKKLQVWFAGTAEVEHTRRLPIQMAGIQFLCMQTGDTDCGWIY